MASYFTQYHIKVRDIVDVLLRHTSRDDDADPLGSMYVDGAFDPIPMLNAQSPPAAH